MARTQQLEFGADNNLIKKMLSFSKHLLSKRATTFPSVSYPRHHFSKVYDSCIMSPIFYVNAQPHIGHLYTAVLCDASARYKKAIKQESVFFSIGTDEHGLKIQKRAKEDGYESPKAMCD